MQSSLIFGCEISSFELINKFLAPLEAVTCLSSSSEASINLRTGLAQFRPECPEVGALRADSSLSGLLRAFECERRQWYAQQQALLDRIAVLEGQLVALCHLHDQICALKQETQALRKSVCALWDFVTPDSPPAAAIDFQCMD